MKVSLMQCFLVSIILAIIGYLLTTQIQLNGQTPLLVALSFVISGIVTPWLASLFSAKNKSNTTSKTKNVHSNEQHGSEDVTTLYVGNLPYKANEAAVKEYFESNVAVQSVRLMKDKKTGRRKGYGFIEIINGDVDSIIQQFNDSIFQDRTLKVRPAKDKFSEQ